MIAVFFGTINDCLVKTVWEYFGIREETHFDKLFNNILSEIGTEYQSGIS